MNIPNHITEKISRLYSNNFLGRDEIQSLENWLHQAKSDQQTEQWLVSNWQKAGNIDVDISFEEIQSRIKGYNQQSKNRRIQHTVRWLQQVAAILAIPLLIASVWLLMNSQPKASTMMLATAKGEHTHLFLPDGSEVWLNVDSKLEYSTDYNATNRNLKLNGEAFFKVAKGMEFPFVVEAQDFQVKAIGTEFNILAYDDGATASTYLKEGIVEFNFSPEGKKAQKIRMDVGEIATINKGKKALDVTTISTDDKIGWVQGELIFENEPMNQVFQKIERWFNVTITYNINDFTNETLVVKLKKDETIERLFQIIDQAMGINVNQNENGYVIMRK